MNTVVEIEKQNKPQWSVVTIHVAFALRCFDIDLCQMLTCIYIMTLFQTAFHFEKQFSSFSILYYDARLLIAAVCIL